MGEIKAQEKSQLYTIAIKDENDKINPILNRREKIDGKVILTPVKWLKGKFGRVELSTYHSESLWEDKENINIYLWDNDWEYKLSTAWTGIGRNLLNSLAWADKLWELTISVYGKADAQGKMRPRVSVYNNWQMTNWKLSVDEQKALTDKITKKDWTFVSNDYSELDNKLRSFIEDINKKAEFVKSEDVEKLIADAQDEDIPF